MNNVLKCVIIDDEQPAIDLLSHYVSELSSLIVYKTYSSPLAALNEIQFEDGIDILFLDINMPEISGIELAKLLRKKTKKLVFTTAHRHFAFQAFEVRADHYLLKPIGLGKFIEIVQDIIESLRVQSYFMSNYFFIKGDEKGKLNRIAHNQIIFVEALKNYIVIYTSFEKFVTYLTMIEAENALLNDGRFMRIHKSFIINLEQIKRVTGNTVHMTNDGEIILGISYKERFYNYLNHHTLKTGRR